jgi:DNA segregation ATPase FtsK/SpoIIIE-like protein
MTDPIEDSVSDDQGSIDPVETSQEGTTGDNPAWSSVLNLIDPRVHTAVKTHLSEWDTNYRDLETKYKEAQSASTAFQEFVGIDPQEIRVSLQIAQNIADNPKEVARILAESTGMTLAEAKEVIKEEAKQEAEPEFEFNEDDDPRIKQLWEQNQALQAKQAEFFSQFEQREQEKEQQAQYNNYNKQIDVEWARLAKDDPSLDPKNAGFSSDRMDDLFGRAAILAQKGNKNPLQAAYSAQKSFIDSIKTSVAPPKPTPLFMPTNGNAPPVNESRDVSTTEGRRAKAAEVIAAMRAGG